MEKIKSRKLFIFNDICETIFIDIKDNGGTLKVFDKTNPYPSFDIFSPIANKNNLKIFKIYSKFATIFQDDRNEEYLKVLNKAMRSNLKYDSYWVNINIKIDDNLIDLILFSNSYLENNGFKFKHICVSGFDSNTSFVTIYTCDPNLIPKTETPVDIQIVYI